MIRLVFLLSLFISTEIFSGPLYDHVFGSPTKPDEKKESVQKALDFLHGIIDDDGFKITDALPILRDCYHYLWLLPTQKDDDESTYNTTIQLCKKVRLEILQAGLNDSLEEAAPELVTEFKSFLAIVTTSLVLKSFYIVDELYVDESLVEILERVREDHAFYEKFKEGNKSISLKALEDKIYEKFFLQQWRRCEALSNDLARKTDFYKSEVSREKMNMFFSTLKKTLKADIEALPSSYSYVDEAGKVLFEQHYLSDQFIPSDDEVMKSIYRARSLFAKIVRDIRGGTHHACAEEVEKIADDFVVTSGGASAAPPDFLEIKADSDSTPDEVPGWMASLSKLVWGDTKT